MSGTGTSRPWLLIAGASLLLIASLRAPVLVVFALGAIAVAYFMVTRTPSNPEVQALRSSLNVTCEEIDDILQQYDTFAHGRDADSLADRTLHRPALLDEDSDDPDIAAFHDARSASRRFLNRMQAKLSDHALTPKELERLLSTADGRYAALRERWRSARRAARRLGP